MKYQRLELNEPSDILNFAQLCRSDLHVDLSNWPNLQEKLEDTATEIVSYASCDIISPYHKILVEKAINMILNNYFDFIDLIILLDLIYHQENPIPHFSPQISLDGIYKEKTHIMQYLFGVDQDYMEVDVQENLRAIIEVLNYPIDRFVEFRNGGVYLK